MSCHFRDTTLDRDPTHISKERLMVKVVPEKIEVFDFGLMLRGYNGRQLWQART